ncbi:hypothetical protein SLA2020_182760 [Shorea laevis]
MKLQTEIPDHRPYSFMIRRAIEELNQTKGSSNEAVSKFTMENYQHIPFAHEVLLSNHLQKLCDRGEIVITNDVNYAFEQGDSSL